MKNLFILLSTLILTMSLCACSFGKTNNTTEPDTTTTQATTQEPTVLPTMPPIEPNVPETTESRGSTDDKQDAPNETTENSEKGADERMRRRIMN